MYEKQFAAELRATIEDIKSSGIDSVSCEKLIDYLTAIEESPDTEIAHHNIEKFKADLVNQNEHYKHTLNIDMEMFRSVIMMGQSAIRSAFLLNGGASIAMLAFISHLVEVNVSKVPEFASCLLIFTFGVFAITVTAGATYLSQMFYATHGKGCKTIGIVLHVISISLCITSYGMFIWGLCKTYHSFLAY